MPAGDVAAPDPGLLPSRFTQGVQAVPVMTIRSYSPAMAEGLFELGKTLSNSGTVKPRNRELAILGLASVIKAPYIAFCHRDMASKLDITDEQWDQGLAGQTPEGLSEQERLVYRLGRTLPLATEPLDEGTWQEALTVMTKVELVGIVHVVSAYRWVSLLDLVHADPNWHGSQTK